MPSHLEVVGFTRVFVLAHMYAFESSGVTAGDDRVKADRLTLQLIWIRSSALRRLTLQD
jgi:hypothetical protein